MQLKVKEQAELYGTGKDFADYVRGVMTLPNPKYRDALKYGRWAGHIPKNIELYFDLPGGGIAFPRGWANTCLRLLRKQGFKLRIQDYRRYLQPVRFEFKGELRDYQQQAVDAVLKRDFGILDCPTGGGKTIMGLAAIAARKQPTLILVHTKELLYQWADRIQEFLGIVPGVIGAGWYTIEPVTVALVHTARKHLQDLPQHFGHLIVDECHRTPASIFTHTVKHFDSKYMLGLSATAYRRDGLDAMLHLILGERVHRVDPKQLKANGAVLAPKVIRRETAFRYDYQDDYPKMISTLTKDQERNRQIAADVIRQAKSRAGTALVVSDRVQHCQALADLIQDSGLEVQVLTGQCSKDERESIVAQVKAGEVDVLVSTVQLLGEGFDCSGLSSLFMATPIKFKGRLAQVVGRILRPGDGKLPVVYDYVDTFQPVLNSQARERGKALSELAA